MIFIKIGKHTGETRKCCSTNDNFEPVVAATVTYHSVDSAKKREKNKIRNQDHQIKNDCSEKRVHRVANRSSM